MDDLGINIPNYPVWYIICLSLFKYTLSAPSLTLLEVAHILFWRDDFID